LLPTFRLKYYAIHNARVGFGMFYLKKTCDPSILDVQNTGNLNNEHLIAYSYTCTFNYIKTLVTFIFYIVNEKIIIKLRVN